MNIPGEKLVVKLWETVADKGIGGLLKPWQARRVGRAENDIERERILIIAQAQRDAEQIAQGKKTLSIDGNSLRLIESHGHPDSSASAFVQSTNLAGRANDAVVADAIRRDINVAKALLTAEQTLKGDSQEPPAQSVDDDWLYRWRDNASGVSNEKLQILWGRILAGEIKAPGNYSFRTLEFLRNLTQTEAKKIERLSPFVVEDSIYRDAKEILIDAGVSFEFLLSMQELGVLSGVDIPGLRMTMKSFETSRFICLLKANGTALIATAQDASIVINLPVYKLTEIGAQILRLCMFPVNVKYLENIADNLKAQNVKVAMGTYVDIASGRTYYEATREL